MPKNIKGFIAIFTAVCLMCGMRTFASDQSAVIYSSSFKERGEFNYGGKNPNGYAVIKTDNKPEYAPYSDEPVHSLQMYKSDTTGNNYVSAECDIDENGVKLSDTDGIIYEIKINADVIGSCYFKLFGSTKSNGKMTFPVWIKDGKVYNFSDSVYAGDLPIKRGWFTLYAVADSSGKLDIYAGNKKINSDTKLELFEEGEETIKDFGMAVTGMKERFEGVRVDELKIMHKAPVYLERVLLKNGSTSEEINDTDTSETSQVNKIVMDFNTIIDSESISNISVIINGVPAEKITVECDSTDPTRVNLIFDKPLPDDSSIKLEYSKIQDVFGTQTEGSLNFMTKKLPIPNESGDLYEGALVSIDKKNVRLCYDVLPDIGNINAENITLNGKSGFFNKAEIIDGNVIELTFAQQLSRYNADFTLSFDEEASKFLGGFSFKTEPRAVVSEAEFYLAGNDTESKISKLCDGNVILKLKLNNRQEGTIHPRVILMLYRNDKMEKIEYSTGIIEEKNSDGTFEVSLEVNDTENGECMLKCYVIDSFTAMQPLFTDEIVLKN